MTSDGKWKLHLPHDYRVLVQGGNDGFHGKYQQLRVDTVLYDMVHDPYEKNNVYGHFPEVSERLLRYAEQHKEKYFK